MIKAMGAAPPRSSYNRIMRFIKYHALGNDYLVFDPGAQEFTLTTAHIQRICHRNFGIGSDGILVPQLQSANFQLQIFNPDGSEAEKSGNGLRIFAHWLFDEGLVGADPFFVQTCGGQVCCHVLEGGQCVQVEMGQVVFEALSANLNIAGLFNAHIVNIGNPHCVIFCEEVSGEAAKAFGPLIETHPRFPNRTNVQFVQVLNRQNIRLEIWERGAGYTLASGSSSCAAAAVAVKLGLCDGQTPITAHMPGGALQIEIAPDFQACMTGPVTRIATVELAAEALQ